MSEVPREVEEHFNSILRNQQAKERQGYFLPHIEWEWQGHRWRGVGSKLHWRPLTEPFDEFMIHLLLWELGERWFKDQRALPAAERHFIMQCWDGYNEWKSRTMQDSNRHGASWAAVPDGWAKTLYALAVDVYSLLHRGEFPKRLRNRLLHPDQYQGARYEIAVAGMFIRLGCTVRFLDSSTSEEQITHCEFIATHNATGIEVGVEAKSRHRPGVLGRQGTMRQPDAVPGDIGPLVTKALGQAPDGKPFIVFVDVNAPMDVATGAVRPWVEDVESYFRSLGRGTPNEPVKWNAIVATNYSFHYATSREADPGQFIALSAHHALAPLPSEQFLEHLALGLTNYGAIPQLA